MIKLIIIWLLNLFDYIMTIHYVGKYGIWVEQNPIMVYLLQYPILAFIVKMGIPTLCCVLCYLVKDKPIIKIATWVLLIFYTWVAINHIFLELR
jgi:hypothetical protein